MSIFCLSPYMLELFLFFLSFSEIDEVIRQVSDEQVVETVNLESENEEAENGNNEEMQDPENLAVTDTELLAKTDNAQNAHEQDREEEDEQDTVDASDAGKENVRPQSTPISANSDSTSNRAKVEAIPKLILPLTSAAASKPVLMEKNDAVASTAEHDASESAQSSKSSDAIMVKVVHPKKKKEGLMRIRSQNIAHPGKYVMKKRKHAFVEDEDNNDDDDENGDDHDSDDDDDDENGDNDYVIVRTNSMKPSQKRAKKSKRVKYVYVSQ